jgi:hypothetical protein
LADRLQELTAASLSASIANTPAFDMCEGLPTSLDHTYLFQLKKSHQKQTDLALRIRREQHDT